MSASQIKTGLKAYFATGVFSVTFIKADGILRTLKLSLAEDKLPSDYVASATSRSQPDTIISVFDLEDQAWKSIIISEIISIHAVFA